MNITKVLAILGPMDDVIVQLACSSSAFDSPLIVWCIGARPDCQPVPSSAVRSAHEGQPTRAGEQTRVGPATGRARRAASRPIARCIKQTRVGTCTQSGDSDGGGQIAIDDCSAAHRPKRRSARKRAWPWCGLNLKCGGNPHAGWQGACSSALRWPCST